MSNKTRFILLIIVAAGGLLRLAYLQEAVNLPDFKQPGLDAGYHNYWARAITFGEWSPPPEQNHPQIQTQPYFRPPGYPYFLALVYQLTGGSYTGARLVQFILGLVNVLLAGWFMHRWFGAGPALITAAICASFWTFIYYEGEFLEPVLLVTLTWGALIFLGEWKRKPTSSRALAAGVMIGLFALVRPNILVVAPFLAAWMFVQCSAGYRKPQAWVRPIGCVVLAAMLMIAPATLRNWIVARDLVLISSNGGINLLMGQDAEAVANHASDATGHWNCFDYPLLIQTVSAEAGRPMKASEVSSWYGRQAWEIIASNPTRTFQLMSLKTLLFWGPREVSNNKVEELERRQSRVLRHLPISFSLLTGAGFIGFITQVVRRSRRRSTSPMPTDHNDQWAMSILMALFIAGYFISFLPYIAAGQYRVPVIPLLAAFSSIAAVEIFRPFRQGAWKTSLIWLMAVLAAWGVLSVNYSGYRVQPARWHLARAISAERSDQWELSEQEYLKAMALAPSLDLLPARLGTLYARRERLPEAVHQFEQALALNPDNPNTHFNLGLALALEGNVTGAIPHFAATVALNPEHADAHFNLAAAYQLNGEPEKAMDHRRRTVELRKQAGSSGSR